ncbi:MAG: hypothetical protein A2Z88_08530 [Omnitrophica WOR_2 bacterium GWA2_47_8]|nr:MAG: hypothetical protein A2Z88_08530 [Omnitrophica WOR_2 bacterium GWA2_47_8]
MQYKKWKMRIFAKGQISLFFILGAIILVGVGLFLFIPRGTDIAESKEPVESASFAEPVASYVTACLEDSLDKAITALGIRGGYFGAAPQEKNLSFISVPVYFSVDRSSVPTPETLEEELSNAVGFYLEGCINEFSPLREIGYSIEAGEMEVLSILATESTQVQITYPLTIKREDSTQSLDSFSARTSFSLLSKYSVVKALIDKQKEYPQYVIASDLIDSATVNDFTFELTPFDDSSTLHALFFNTTELKNSPFTYAYMVKYSSVGSSEVESETNINALQSVQLEAFVGYEFTYRVETMGEGLTFSDNSPLFDIDPKTGTITFTPTNDQGGNHVIIIKSTDSLGNAETILMELEVNGFNRKPIISDIPSLTAQASELFAYQVNAYDPDEEEMFYLDNSNLFNIHPVKGTIAFTPSSDMVGEQDIMITVVDRRGEASTKEFRLVIT